MSVAATIKKNREARAADRFAVRQAECRRHLEAISKILENEVREITGEINWGHVGTVTHVADKLAEIREFLGDHDLDAKEG